MTTSTNSTRLQTTYGNLMDIYIYGQTPKNAYSVLLREGGSQKRIYNLNISRAFTNYTRKIIRRH
jgi:hypothetical protein